jgi:hypothetical protein
MPWRTTAVEDLDDDHATAAAWTVRLAGIGSGRLALRFRSGEQLTRAGDIVGARAFGEQAVVADAVQAFGQHVDEEAADELAVARRAAFCAAGPVMRGALSARRDVQRLIPSANVPMMRSTQAKFLLRVRRRCRTNGCACQAVAYRC